MLYTPAAMLENSHVRRTDKMETFSNAFWPGKSKTIVYSSDFNEIYVEPIDGVKTKNDIFKQFINQWWSWIKIAMLMITWQMTKIFSYSGSLITGIFKHIKTH